MPADEIVIVGGGAIGLSIAWELAQQGVSVRLIERQQLGQETSWAGAGMIPPGEIRIQNPAYRALARLSAALWPEMSTRLREQTGIDNEYQQCGAVILPEASASSAAWLAEQEEWQQQGIDVQPWQESETDEQPRFRGAPFASAFQLPEQAQVRNPRHLKALIAACQELGVRFSTQETVLSVQTAHNRVSGVTTSRQTYTAQKYVWTAGAWSSDFSQSLNLVIPVFPIRGQIVLLKTASAGQQILEQGKRYIVPRRDGRVLIGATEEQGTFERRVSETVTAGLRGWAEQFWPELAEAELERVWCGFRPGTPDQMPILGPLPHWENTFIATGHYRAGLSLSPITARLMRHILLGEPVPVPLNDFLIDRFQPTHGTKVPPN